MWRIATLLTLAAVGAAVFAGCGRDEDTDTGGVSASEVAGRFYVATKVTGHTLVPGSTLTLSFDGDGRLSAAAGCNTIAGPYEIASGILRLTGEAATTMMGCEPALHEQDEWLTALLTGGVAIAPAAAKGLTLTKGDVRIELADRPEGGGDAGGKGGTGGAHFSPPPIAGTDWELVSLGARGSSSPFPTGFEPPTLRISPNGKATVFTGCNRGTGRAEVREDGFVHFGPLALTRKKCDGVEARTEEVVLQVLDGEAAAGFSEQNLSLARQGSHLLYRAR